jgi:hypothetical protein
VRGLRDPGEFSTPRAFPAHSVLDRSEVAGLSLLDELHLFVLNSVRGTQQAPPLPGR